MFTFGSGNVRHVDAEELKINPETSFFSSCKAIWRLERGTRFLDHGDLLSAVVPRCPAFL